MKATLTLLSTSLLMLLQSCTAPYTSIQDLNINPHGRRPITKGVYINVQDSFNLSIGKHNAQGELHGKNVTYTNGGLYSITTYRNGKKHGPERVFYSQKHPVTVFHYRNDSVVKAVRKVKMY